MAKKNLQVVIMKFSDGSDEVIHEHEVDSIMVQIVKPDPAKTDGTIMTQLCACGTPFHFVAGLSDTLKMLQPTDRMLFDLMYQAEPVTDASKVVAEFAREILGIKVDRGYFG